jgi:hypothetical protein
MPFLYLSTYLFARWNISEWVIANVLASRGYKRHVVLGKPGLPATSKWKPLKFALEHVHWTIEQRYSILWSDETWVNRYHRRIWVTGMAGEEFDDTCLFSKVQRRAGGCFRAASQVLKKGLISFGRRHGNRLIQSGITSTLYLLFRDIWPSTPISHSCKTMPLHMGQNTPKISLKNTKL